MINEFFFLPILVRNRCTEIGGSRRWVNFNSPSFERTNEISSFEYFDFCKNLDRFSRKSKNSEKVSSKKFFLERVSSFSIDLCLKDSSRNRFLRVVLSIVFSLKIFGKNYRRGFSCVLSKKFHTNNLN
jgi:hypothetical protein